MGVGAQDEVELTEQIPGTGAACYGGGKFCLDYSFSTVASSEVCIRIQVMGRGWAGFLLYAPDGMTGGEGYYMYVDADNNDEVGMYNIVSPGLSSPSFSDEPLQDVDLSRIVAFYDDASGFTEFTFYKDRNRQPVLPLSAPQKIDFSWAYGDSAGFGKHAPGACGKLKFDFFSGGVEAVPPADSVAMYQPVLVAAGIFFVCGLALHWLRPLQQSRLGSILLQQRLGPMLPKWFSSHSCAAMKLLHTFTFDALPALADMLVIEAMLCLLYCAAMGAMLHIGHRAYTAVGQSGYAFTFGHMACVNITLIMLPISRNSIFSLLFGCSYERMINFHRQIARPLLATVYAHFVTMLALHGNAILTSVDPIKFGSNARDGFFAMILFSFVVLVAWEPIRRRCYTAFRVAHIVGAPVAFIFSMLHSVHLRWYMIAPLVLWGLDQLVRFGRPLLAYSVALEETRVLPAGKKGSRVSHLKVRVKGFSPAFEPGSYVFLYMPSVSLIEWHPFSISSHPAGTSFNPDAGTLLSFHILDTGARSFTSRLADQLEAASGSPAALETLTKGMLIDGPYGRLSLDIRRYHTVVLTCGGVGCTPMLSLLQFLLSAAKDATNFPLLRRVVFIWVNRDRVPFDTWAPELLNQVATDPSGKFSLHLFATSESSKSMPKFSASRADDDRVAQLDHVHVEAVAPASPLARSPPPPPLPLAPSVLPPAPTCTVHPGRPNFHRLFSDVLAGVGVDQPTLNAYDHSWSNDSRAAHVAVLACGPTPMVEQVQDEAQRMRMHFHKETFAF